jgi:hypothetical protein
MSSVEAEQLRLVDARSMDSVSRLGGVGVALKFTPEAGIMLVSLLRDSPADQHPDARKVMLGGRASLSNMHQNTEQTMCKASVAEAFGMQPTTYIHYNTTYIHYMALRWSALERMSLFLSTRVLFSFWITVRRLVADGGGQAACQQHASQQGRPHCCGLANAAQTHARAMSGLLHW